MRKVKDVVLGDEAGRDKGKKFQITEMSAAQAEKWAIRAFLALSKSGIEVPEDVAEAGIAGLASFGLKGLASLNFADAEPLLDEMMGCVQVKPDPRNPSVVRNLIEDDIEEIGTRIKLRAEVFSLHTGFFVPGANSEQVSTTAAPGSRTMSMFRGRSAQ